MLLLAGRSLRHPVEAVAEREQRIERHQALILEHCPHFGGQFLANALAFRRNPAEGRPTTQRIPLGRDRLLPPAASITRFQRGVTGVEELGRGTDGGKGRDRLLPGLVQFGGAKFLSGEQEFARSPRLA